MALMSHYYTKSMMVGLAIAFLLLPCIFVCMRIWAKILVKRVAWDDYLTLGALAVSVTCCALQLATAVHGHLGSHQVVDENGNAVMDDPGLIYFQQTKFALNMISILGLGLVKCSILVLYKNIFNVPKFRIVVFWALGFVICWTVAFFFSHLFTCYPITVFIEPSYGNSCVETVPMFMSLLFTDVFADLVILILPIPMVFSLKLNLQKQLAVIGMFMLGASVCAISITRVIATFAIAEEYVKHPNDVIYYTAPVFFWTNIELSLAIVCACLPTLRPIWLHFYPTKGTRTGYISYDYGSSGQAGAKKSSYGTTLKSSGRGRTPYEELDEVELTRQERSLPASVAVGGEDRSISQEHGIVKEVTIHQTLG